MVNDITIDKDGNKNEFVESIKLLLKKMMTKSVDILMCVFNGTRLS